MCETTAVAVLELPAGDQAAGIARRFLRESRCAGHHAAVLDEAELLVSELVTNGLRHAAPPLTLEVRCDAGDGMRIAVSDGSDGRLAPRTAGSDAENGRGLTLIDYISDDWGIEETPEGKTVWVLLDSRTPA